MQIVATFKRGVWQSEVIDRNALPMNHGVHYSIRYMIKVYQINGCLSDYPIQYDNGTIAYDQYKPPRDKQRATKAAFRKIKELNNNV